MRPSHDPASHQDTPIEPSSDTYSIFTVAEFCSRFRVAKSTVLRLIKSGELRVKRIGRSIRILDDL